MGFLKSDSGFLFRQISYASKGQPRSQSGEQIQCQKMEYDVIALTYTYTYTYTYCRLELSAELEG